MTARFRPLTLDDGEVVEDLALDVFDARYGEGWTGAQIMASLAGPVQCWGEIVEHGNECVGFSLCRQVMDEVELLLIGVRPDYRRQGLARQMIARAADEAIRRGAGKIHLEVRANNEDARAMYGRFGFRIIGKRAAYYTGVDGKRFDAVTMLAPLPLGNLCHRP